MTTEIVKISDNVAGSCLPGPTHDVAFEKQGTSLFQYAVSIPSLSDLVEFKPFRTSTTGVNNVVAGRTGKKLRLLGWLCTLSGGDDSADEVIWQDTASTEIVPLDFLPGSGISVQQSPWGWGQTAVGAGIDLNIVGDGTAKGVLVFVAV